MTKRTYLFLAAAALALASCSNDDDFADRPGDGRVAVNFSGGITLTRATGDAWDLNDGIGIYMVETGTQTVVDNAANRRYVTAAGDGRFSPASEDQTIYFPLDANDKVDFIAYYPQAALTGNTYAVDVTDQSVPSAIDLLWSNNATAKDKTVQTVDLKFYHRLSRVEVELKAGAGVSEAELAGTTVTLSNQPVKADFDVLQNTMATRRHRGILFLGKHPHLRAGQEDHLQHHRQPRSCRRNRGRGNCHHRAVGLAGRS